MIRFFQIHESESDFFLCTTGVQGSFDIFDNKSLNSSPLCFSLTRSGNMFVGCVIILNTAKDHTSFTETPPPDYIDKSGDLDLSELFDDDSIS